MNPKQNSTAPPQREGARVVVLIEDDDDGRTMLEMLLSAHGFEVHAAPDARRGLSLIGELRPHAALVDVGLPAMTGLDLVRRVRAELEGPILMIALTGYGSDADRASVEAAGFDHLLVKPIDFDQLMGVL